ncbi:hypothetical protein N7520_002014 [Penicillium odoratum]|uniref:uncharacterized protein n=1 Tax=Penicillium odoratum TaxID=1167516 RepID=UPI0025497FB3|nr:uncharacterized protein N7520_002014 [Penicillium odoratum]KAJ5778768.1 hypothetical protein N7520_002014 [Penicillium odoratum]
MDSLTAFLAENSHIQYSSPDSPDFDDLSSIFVINAIKEPSMVVRPRSAEDISALVSLCIANNLPFTIRAGGHDMFGRCQVNDAVTIDMREISHVHVDHKSQTARVGGGVIFMKLVKELEKHKMAAPTPVTPSVGFVGWALHGGYGLLSSKYGLGVDQIVGATVINAHGVIQEADDMMLRAIRGAGGTVGVIAELRIRIYPLDQVLAGAITYQPHDLSVTIQNFNDKLRQAKMDGIPSALGMYQLVNNSAVGKTLTVIFVWASSEFEDGQRWLSKVTSWAPVAVNAVHATTLTAFNEVANSMIPEKVYGTIYALIFYSLTPEVVNVIRKHALLQPNSADVMYGIHELRAEAPHSAVGSVFDSRSPHITIEIIPISQSPDIVREMTWAENFHLELSRTNPANVPPFSYISLTPSNTLNMKGIFGSKYQDLLMIKKKCDPLNKFNNALVQL